MLSPKQAAFVREYLVDFNATRAAIRAGYSEATARAQGSRLLTNVDIKAAIEEGVMSPEEVKLRMSDIARGDLADLMEITSSGFTFRLLLNENGERVVNPKTKLIKKIKQKVTTFLSKQEDGEDREIIETELELYSAHEALRDLGKYHKLFTDRTDIDITTAGEKISNGATDEGFNRSVSTLAHAVREILSGADAKPKSPVDATKQATVVGAANEGG